MTRLTQPHRIHPVDTCLPTTDGWLAARAGVTREGSTCTIPEATAVMRPRDANAFRSVALIQKVYIIVRQTNAQSIQWIGNTDIMAKPIDCKPKTADFDADIDSHHVETAGLVVNPRAAGLDHVFRARQGRRRPGKAWQKFFSRSAHERGAYGPLPAAQRRRCAPGRAHPGWAVQMCRTSRHHGCLLHSTYPARPERQYVHGDYDLFGIAPAGRPTLIRRRNGSWRDRIHSRGPNTQSVQFAVNALSGLALVKHGEQSCSPASTRRRSTYSAPMAAYAP